MIDKAKRESGSITLETSIVLPIFILLFLFIYGFFAVISAQNQMLHTLVQSTKSLSLDSYLNEKVSSAARLEDFWGGLGDVITDFARAGNSPNFSTTVDWYKSDTGDPTVAKDRFVGYFTGGDETLADEKLKDLGIVGGLSGLTFKTEIDDEKLTVKIAYEIQYLFDFGGVGRFPMEQAISTQMWM